MPRTVNAVPLDGITNGGARPPRERGIQQTRIMHNKSSTKWISCLCTGRLAILGALTTSDSRHHFKSGMKPPEIFQLAVRLLGLVFLYQSLPGLPVAMLGICSAVVTFEYDRAWLVTIWQLVVAGWLFHGAPPITRVAYPDSGSKNAK